MNDVFISYSRRDKVFTQKLVEALKAQGRELWADWEDIPPGSDWFAEIKQGIEESQSVLFVLSPEWIKSNECRKEMDYAVKMGKRLVPVIWQNIDPKDAPPELAKINWIFMRESDDFDKGFQLVGTTLDTDLDWLKMHTRLQTRALEWDKKNKDHSFVLRGKDLEDAEQFLSHGSHKSPEPTDLQGDYILISRKEAVRIQRMILAGVVAALVVSVLLGIVAAFQWQAARRAEATAVAERELAVAAEATAVAAKETAVAAEAEAVAAKETAVAERDRADLNAKIASSRELAAASVANLNVDPERSLLLALQAIQITNSVNRPILPEAEDALRNAVRVSRIRLVLPGNPENDIKVVAFSPDGKTLATGGYQYGSINLWDVSAFMSSPSSTQKVPLVEFQSGGSPTKYLAFSPDGSRLASATADGMAYIWDVKTGQQLQSLQASSGEMGGLAFSPDGARLATSGDGEAVKIWNAATGAELLSIPRSGRTQGIAFSPDGRLLASVSEAGLLLVSDSQSGGTIYQNDSVYANDVKFSPNGQFLAWGNSIGTVTLMELSTQEIEWEKPVHTNYVSGIAFSPDGTLLASASWDHTASVQAVETGEVKFTLAGSDIRALDSVSFSPDGKYLATDFSGGEAKIWDAAGISGYEVAGFPAEVGTINRLAFNPDGSALAVAGDDPTGRIFSLTNSGNNIDLIGHAYGLTDIALSADGAVAATSSWDGQVVIWDAQSGKILKQFTESTGVLCVALNADGTVVAAGVNDMLVAWDVKTGKELFRQRGADEGGYGINNVAFNPDGNSLASVNDNWQLILWNASTGAKIYAKEEHIAWTRAVAYSPDGKTIITGATDSLAILWEATSGLKRFTLSHAAGVQGVDFSVDSQQAATASGDGTVRTWEVSSGTLLYTLNAFAGPVNEVAFSPDGKFLVSGGKDGVVRLYYAQVNDVIALAQTRITRSLTESECRTYLHKLPCPDNLVKPSSSNGQDTNIQPVTVTANLRSGEGTTAVDLNFTNNSNEYLKLYWIDWDGVEQYYGDLGPNSTFVQGTYNTHAWRIRDANGNAVAEYVCSTDKTQTITINADKTVVLP